MPTSQNVHQSDDLTRDQAFQVIYTLELSFQLLTLQATFVLTLTSRVRGKIFPLWRSQSQLV